VTNGGLNVLAAEVAGGKVKRGTWLLAVRVLDDELWGQVKDGSLSGLSIGGAASRAPEKRGAAEKTSAERADRVAS
jgi:hypothetical protein